MLFGQLGLDEFGEWLDVGVGDRSPKGAASEIAKDAIGIDKRLLRDDFNSLGVVVNRSFVLCHVAKNAAMAFRRPGVVQRAFDLDPVDAQPRSLIIVGTDFRDGLRVRQPIRRDADVIASLEVIDELRHSWLVGGGIEVADEMVLRPHQHRSRINAKRYRLAVTLMAEGRDADAIPTSIRRIELSHRDRVPRG